MNRLLLCGVTLLCISFSCFSSSLSLEQQRKLYSQAVELQEQDKWFEAQQNRLLIGDYPLAYLLEYKLIKEHFGRESLFTVQAFINKYSTYKTSYDLQRDYLRYLGKNQYWSEFLSFYPALPKSNELKCFHFQAKIAQGKSKDIWPLVKKTWLTGYPLANSCDTVFQQYLESNKISELLIWQRFKLAYLKNQKSLMSYLLTLMNRPNRAIAEQIYALNNNPKKLLTSQLFKNRQHASYAFLTTSIKRLAKKDIHSGIKIYSLYDQKMAFTFSEKMDLKRYLCSRILIRNEASLFSWLDKELLYLGDKKLIERRIRYAIKVDNWQDIEYWLAKLTVSQRQHSKWLYWQARVLENKQQTIQANNLYQKIATKRNYYGFLAAQKLGLAYQLNAQTVEDELQSLSSFKSQLTHIAELHFHEHRSLLKREWLALLNKNNLHLQQQLGLYASQQGWSHLSVLASIRSKSWDALNIRFPDAKQDLFLANANKHQLQPTYVYAITRQESSFDEFAFSPAGARGYMQLMPATASETARKIGFKEYRRKAQLTQGDINVHLGSAYFNGLLQRYNGNRILATAAYNAGPHRVDRWQANKKGRVEQGLMMDSWVETIPYKETRRYVKNVLAYNLIYQHILDKPLEFLTDKELHARF